MSSNLCSFFDIEALSEDHEHDKKKSRKWALLFHLSDLYIFDYLHTFANLYVQMTCIILNICSEKLMFDFSIMDHC